MRDKAAYLQIVKDWKDELPAPVVEEYTLPGDRKIKVIRDDLLPYGGKSRYCDYFVKTFEKDEIVFGNANPVGWGPVSMAYLCKKYNKKFTVFFAARKEPNIYQKKVLELGGNIVWLKMGMLTVCRARAREYVALDDNNRQELPLGLEHDKTIGGLVKVLSDLNLNPREVWSVGSSGSLNRGMQIAFPNARAFVVQTGHDMSDVEVGRATRFKCQYKYDKAVKANEMPPFPSVPHYDAKAWSYIVNHAADNSLFYNVAGY